MSNKTKAVLLTLASLAGIVLLMISLWVYPIIFPIVTGGIILFSLGGFTFMMYKLILTYLDEIKNSNKK